MNSYFDNNNHKYTFGIVVNCLLKNMPYNLYYTQSYNASMTRMYKIGQSVFYFCFSNISTT